MSKISHAVESILFRSRFLLAPLYLGLVGALALLAYRFIVEFWHLAEKTADMSASEFTLSLLALLDLTLLANLILMVIFAGYENFVSRIDIATESKDRPHWMGTIDFSGLKIKLIGLEPRRNFWWAKLSGIQSLWEHAWVTVNGYFFQSLKSEFACLICANRVNPRFRHSCSVLKGLGVSGMAKHSQKNQKGTELPLHFLSNNCSTPESMR